MARATRTQTRPRGAAAPKRYQHSQDTAARPEIGAAPRFRAKAPPAVYRYDSSLAPALDWDTNPARETAAFLLACIEDAAALPAPHDFPEPRELRGADGAVLLRVGGLADAVAAPKRMQTPLLNWAGKAERQSFEVPTLPLFVHERLSTAAIVRTLEDHRRRPDQGEMDDLFGDPRMSLSRQVDAYQHRNKWVNRLILGDSLVVMNSLLRFEGLGGQVQMIYIDPPYGVKFGSNFQPFVRKRDVSNNDDADMTREPEMVQAYRDTWQLGLHSYLTYLRDRLLVARDLLTPSGSVFVQISDENLHHVRELMDEVFGADNFLSIITFEKTTGTTTATLPATSDYILWYAKEKAQVRFRKLYKPQRPGTPGALEYRRVELADGRLVPISQFNSDGVLTLPEGARVFATGDISSKGGDDPDIELFHDGQRYVLSCKPNRHWKQGVEGTRRLWEEGRLLRQGELRIYKRYLSDFPFLELSHVWTDTRGEANPVYVVQTSSTVVRDVFL